MSAAPAEPTPAPAATPEPPAAPAPATPAADAPKAPPWGDDFNAEQAWDRIQKQASDIDKMRTQGVLTADDKKKLGEYDKLVAANQTDLERAQQAAQAAEGTISAMRERVASADIRAALTGIVPDPESVIEDLNIARFIGDDGEVKTEAVTALRAKYAALAPEGKRLPAANPAQGSSGSGAPDLGAQIAAAQSKGDWQTAIALETQKLATAPPP